VPSLWEYFYRRMEISARGLGISLCHRTLADGSYDQTSSLNLRVLIVQKFCEFRVESQLYVSAVSNGFKKAKHASCGTRPTQTGW